MVLIYNSLCGFILGLLLFSWYLAILPGSHGLDYCSFVSLESDCISLLTLFFFRVVLERRKSLEFSSHFVSFYRKSPLCFLLDVVYEFGGNWHHNYKKSINPEKKEYLYIYFSLLWFQQCFVAASAHILPIFMDLFMCIWYCVRLLKILFLLQFMVVHC